MKWRIKYTLSNGHVNYSLPIYQSEQSAANFCTWFNDKGSGITATHESVAHESVEVDDDSTEHPKKKNS